MMKTMDARCWLPVCWLGNNVLVRLRQSSCHGIGITTDAGIRGFSQPSEGACAQAAG